MVLKCNWRLYNPLSGGSSARARFRRTNHNDEASVGTLSEHLNLTTHMESRMRGNVRVPVRRSGTGKPTVARPPGVPSPTQHLPHSRRLRLRQRSPAFVGRQRRQRRAAPLDDMGAGAIVAGRHPLPPSEMAERAARPEAGRSGTRDAMGKATDREGTIWKYAFGEFYQTLEPEPTIGRPSSPRRGRPRS